MNILFLTQRVPYPPDRGDRIATYNYLRHFWARGDRVRIGCLSGSAQDRDAIEFLRQRSVDVCAPRVWERGRKIASLRGILTGQPLTLPYFADRRLRTAVQRWVAAEPPDVVFIYSSSMAQYALDIESHRIMYFAELDSDKWRQYAKRRRASPGRWIYEREARLLLDFERRVAHSFESSAVVSEVEKALFMECIPGVIPQVIPNGVDVVHFRSATDDSREPHTAVFTGVMDYEPNVDGVLWFVEAAWPQVRATCPDAKFLIVGSRPVPAIRALDGRDGITVTGWVDETPPYFDRSAVTVAPLRLARGLQNKVLEAMSMSLPVVATTRAAQGLGTVPSDTLIVRDTAEEISTEILRLFSDPTDARAIGQRAAAFVRDNFQWRNTYDQLDRLLAERVQGCQ